MSDAIPSRQGPRAGFGTRLLASLVDGIIVGVISGLLGAILGNAGRGLGVVVGLAYYIYLEGSPSGQTVGKKLLNIRVVNFNTGGELGFGGAALRYVGRILSAIPCLLGYFWMLWDGQKQTWHDKIATSVVVPTSSYPVSSWP